MTTTYYNFPENLRKLSEEQREHFCRDIIEIAAEYWKETYLTMIEDTENEGVSLKENRKMLNLILRENINIYL